MDETLAVKFGLEQFRADIVMVEHKASAEELERQRDEEDQIWRVAALDDVEAAFAPHSEQQAELVKQRSGIFEQEGEAAPGLERQRVAIDRDTVEHFVRRPVALGRRAYHPH